MSLTPAQLATLSPEERAFLLSAPTEQKQSEEPESDGPLTRQETIKTVQDWVVGDAEYELPQRRTFEEMVENLQAAGESRGTELSFSDFESIVRKYAPDAPHKTEPKLQSGSRIKSKHFTYPVELEPLVKSGVAVVENKDTGPVSGHVLLHRCTKCGKFDTKCCGPVDWVTAVRFDENVLTAYGRQAVGLDPITPPKPPKTIEQIWQEQKSGWHKEPWWIQFSGVNELQGTGQIRMFIENFLPEGVTLICGLAKEGKSWLALAIAKALTSGKKLFERRGFEVPEIIPVIYLAAEGGDGGLKLRCKKFGITENKSLFLARTLTKGLMLKLDDPELEAAVKAMRPVIVLETLIRFNDSSDEDSATENKKLAQSLFRLIAWGAKAVVVIHHSRKDFKDNPTKEAAARGSGDILAMADVIWAVMQDEKLYQDNTGANEIDVIGWGRDFNPQGMRLALTQKTPDGFTGAEYRPGLVSLLDTTGNFGWVEQGSDLNQTLEKLIQENPSITREDLVKKTGQKLWEVRKALDALGFKRGKGGDATKSVWTRDKIAEAVATVVKAAKAA